MALNQPIMDIKREKLIGQQDESTYPLSLENGYGQH
jgi:hypothetical protein